jgi:predicted permease
MGLLSRLKRTLGLGRNEADINDELQFHLDMDVAEGHREREARLRLGNVTFIAEETRAMGIIPWLDSALQDVRYGFRQLRKTPVLVLAIVLSLTIGIGANTAIFGLVDAAILRPLPVKDPDSLLIVEWTNGGFPRGTTNINGDFSPLAGNRVRASSVGANLYRRLAREQTAFDSLMGIADPNGLAMTVDSSPAEQVSLQYVSSSFFQGLGLSPAVGRAFRDDEDRVGQEPVVIISHRYWLGRLGADPDVLVRTVRLNNTPARIIGVAPRGFFGLRAGQWTDVYAPIAARVAFSQESAGVAIRRGEDDGDWWIRQIGRLRPGVSPGAATTQIAGLFRTMAVPDGMEVEPQNIPELITVPGRRGFNALNERDSGALWILMLLVGVVLLIVCANVANLLLSRSVARQRESAVRLALGAGRMRLFRQHLIESGVLALIAGAAGLALGSVLAQSIHLLFQAGRAASSAFDLHLDLRVLGYTGAIAIAAAMLFGVAPAARAARADLNDSLKTRTRSIMDGGLRLPRLLVSIQIALCLTALVAAGLLGRSLEKLKWSDVGFDRDNLAYASVNPWQARYEPARVGPYTDRVREEISRIPGVLRVSPVEVRLLSGNGNSSVAHFPGRPSRRDADRVDVNRVSDGLFETLGIPLVAGRALDRRDIKARPDTAVVDERFANRFFPNESPLGRRFGYTDNEDSQYEIVGVVHDSRYNSLRREPAPAVYLPFVPGINRGQTHFAIRASIDSGRLAEAVRKAVASVDPAVPMTEFHTQTALIDRLLRTERLLGFLSGAFGVVALALAAIGLGALLAYAVARRRNEIGVRMALGAAKKDVVQLVVGDSLWMVSTGLLIGLPLSYATGQVLKTALFRLDPLDPWTAALSFLALLTTALLAAWVPARRAASIDPMIALREE